MSWCWPSFSLTITVFKLPGWFGKVALDQFKISRTKNIMLIFSGYEPRMKETKLTSFHGFWFCWWLFCFLFRFATFLSSLLIWWWLEPGFGSAKKLHWLSPKGQSTSFLLLGQAEMSVRTGTSKSFLWFIVAESFREYLKQIIKSIQSRPRICGTHYKWVITSGKVFLVYFAFFLSRLPVSRLLLWTVDFELDDEVDDG